MIFTPDKQTNPINNLTNPINNFTHISIAHRQLTGLQKKKSWIWSLLIIWKNKIDLVSWEEKIKVIVNSTFPLKKINN